jgi:hypothetical protein
MAAKASLASRATAPGSLVSNEKSASVMGSHDKQRFNIAAAMGVFED